MVKHFTIFALFTCLSICLSFSSFAQKNNIPHPNAVKIATDFTVKQQKDWNLTEQDVKEYFVQDHYFTQHNGVTHVYLIQQHKGIELYNGIINVNVLPSGEVLYAGNRFMHNLAGGVNATAPKLNPEEAIRAACKVLNIDIKSALRVKEKRSENEFVFDKGDNVLNDINVKLRYQPINDNEVRLAWDLNLDQPDGQNHWSLRIDALNGKILDKISWTSHCAFHPNAFHRTEECTDTPLSNLTDFGSQISGFGQHARTQHTKLETQNPPPVGVGEGTYRVFALPTESPSFGPRTLVVSPADAKASPFGWHDTDGVAGGEYKITRGNNVWAYLDIDGNNVSDTGEPNGGDTYTFDNPFLPDGEPDTNKLAAQTNLFYMNNMMHDIFNNYGFDEAAGNFQFKNYTGAPGANDYIRAEAQDAAKAATPSTNNANFSSPVDGSSGRMQMFVWTRQGEKVLKVTAPASVAGEYESVAATFGGTITTSPITGAVAVVNDGSSTSTLGCKPLLNTNLTGKIAIIDRGSCFFSEKAYYAQQKGAIACVICNFEDNAMGMSGSTNANLVTIPVVSMKRSDCAKLRTLTESGLQIAIGRPANSTGPNLLDGDFDNGIIAHEYTHGISSRLTGGRLNACLAPGEHAAGEGWSDFLALALTTKPGDRAATVRNTGSYVTRAVSTSNTFRQFPYSTDMKISPLTYDQMIYDPEVHAVGEIWTNVLWDLYWAMVDKYGWDANIMNTNSGNGRAIKLVIDGMKLQPCSPGFLDARNAILAADKANNASENQCLIWDVFARRGMGFNAKQGKNTSYSDGTEGFETMPQCVKQLKMTKKATELIRAGEAITYSLTVTNHKGISATNIVVTDDIPASATFAANSANRTVTVANGVLTWNIAELKNDSSIVLTYRVNTDPTKKSIAQFSDDMESGEGKWDVGQLKDNDNFWEVLDLQSRSGKKSFSIGYPSKGFTDQTLTIKNALTITGAKPVLRFYHKYTSEPGFDAGLIQITTDNGFSWQDLDDKFFRAPYRGKIDYNTFTEPNKKGFWGVQDTFVGSYIDMSSYIGKNIKYRFRFGTDSTESNFIGWHVDDVAVMDMFNYTSKARAFSAQKDTIFAEAAGRGTIVDILSAPLAVKDAKEQLNVKIFPNPTNDVLNINILGGESGETDMQIISADGRLMWRNKTNLFGSKEAIIPVNTGAYPSGIYFVKIQTDKKVAVEKIVKQ
jgi:extracellular elastinolytic metalloproteinase